MTKEKHYQIRANWVKAVVSAFYSAERAEPKTIGAVVVGNRVAVVNLATSEIGIATCSPTDSFDLDTGIAIAYARMTDRHIPDCVLKEYVSKEKEVCVSKLKPGQSFTYCGTPFHFCGKLDKSPSEHPWDKDAVYAVYNENLRFVTYFTAVKDGGNPVTITTD